MWNLGEKFKCESVGYEKSIFVSLPFYESHFISLKFLTDDLSGFGISVLYLCNIHILLIFMPTS